MVRVLILSSIVLFGCTPADASYIPSAIGTLKFGGVTIPATANIIQMTATVQTSGRWGTFATMTGTSGRPTTGGKVLACYGIVISQYTTGAPSCQLLYGGTDIGIDSASAPQNPTYSGNGASAYQYGCGATSGCSYSIYWTVPQGHFPAVKCAGTGSAVLYCWEN